MTERQKIFKMSLLFFEFDHITKHAVFINKILILFRTKSDKVVVVVLLSCILIFITSTYGVISLSPVKNF